MPQKHPHYIVDAFRQKDARSQPVLIERASIVAYSDDDAVREAGMVQAQFNPTFIVVSEVSRKGNRIVHTSAPVFADD